MPVQNVIQNATVLQIQQKRFNARIHHHITMFWNKILNSKTLPQNIIILLIN